MHLTIQPVHQLSAQRWDQIWAFTAAYARTSRGFFEEMLRAKSHVALVYTDKGRQTLVGTASIDTRVVSFEGRDVVMIYTGDVLLREDIRGRNVLQRVGLICFLRARLRHPFKRIYWFLGASTHQAYLVLARGLCSYWPRPELSTPAAMERLRDRFARVVLPQLWDAVDGVFRTGGTKLLNSLQTPFTPRELQDPHIRFFLARNPGYAQGDLLACLAPLDLGNWISILRSGIARYFRRRRR
ncbi:hypothetical protein [Pelomonas cellulosilytica]|uniref:GNAT family N-acetyltransferase n=1 Tax=Pelomonas cellulosilytica TaxID=2906762 RepID=A0ABS8XW65_9BURK|nr:hypothetical protein [Pelomonas sp. P8]MCE4555950.1 hypothetical protein [Pelomonas sp. P8]